MAPRATSRSADWRPELHTALLRVSLGADGDKLVSYDVTTGVTPGDRRRRARASHRRARAGRLGGPDDELPPQRGPAPPGSAVLGWDGVKDLAAGARRRVGDHASADGTHAGHHATTERVVGDRPRRPAPARRSRHAGLLHPAPLGRRRLGGRHLQRPPARQPAPPGRPGRLVVTAGHPPHMERTWRRGAARHERRRRPHACRAASYYESYGGCGGAVLTRQTRSGVGARRCACPGARVRWPSSAPAATTWSSRSSGPSAGAGRTGPCCRPSTPWPHRDGPRPGSARSSRGGRLICRHRGPLVESCAR